MWDNRMSTWRMEKKEAERKAAKDIAKEVAEKRRKMRELCKPITSRPFLKPKGMPPSRVFPQLAINEPS